MRPLLHTFVPQVFAFLCLVILVTLIGHHSSRLSHPLKTASSTDRRHLGWTAGNIEDVFNRTLGFQAVYVVSLKERKDRQDAITLQASVTNLDFTFVNAVVGSDIPQEALPFTTTTIPGQLGCWRSHLDIMRHLVEQNIQTALIIEDDADWDVSLKHQMRGAAEGFRWLLDDTQHTLSPYGDKWDLLWIGHEGITSRDRPHPVANPARRWVVPKDPTVVPPHTRSINFEPDMKRWEDGPEADTQTRIMFLSGQGWGSAAWAVSLKGAEKILNEMSLRPYDTPIDDGMGKLCSREGSDMTCLAPFPAFVGVSRPAGNLNKNSDIGDWDGVNEVATSHRTVFSTRLNMKRILNGETEFLSSNPNKTGEYMTMQQIQDTQGFGWDGAHDDEKRK